MDFEASPNATEDTGDIHNQRRINCRKCEQQILCDDEPKANKETEHTALIVDIRLMININYEDISKLNIYHTDHAENS